MELDDPGHSHMHRAVPAPAWLWCTGAAVVGAVTLSAVPVDPMIYLVVELVVTILALAVLALRRPQPAAMWWPLGVAIAALLVGTVAALIWSPRIQAVDWLNHLLATACIAAALHSWVRDRHRRVRDRHRADQLAGLGAILDAAMITIGLVELTWAAGLGPLLESGHGGGRLAVAAAVFAAGDLIMVAVAAWLTAAGRPIVPADTLLTAALAALLFGDVGLVATLARPGLVPHAVMHAGWIAWILLAAAAMLHPSTRTRRSDATGGAAAPGTRRPAKAQSPAGGQRPGGQPTLGCRSVAVFVALALLGPANWVLDVAVRPEGHHSWMWVLAPAGLSGLLTVLLVVRLVAALRAGEALHHQVVFQADHDVLTGLASRELLRSRLDEALAAVDERPVGLLLIDLDGFKNINDTLGHQLGDDLLIAVADRLRAITSAADVLARLGGDEFGIITSAEPGELADRVVAALGTPHRIDGRDLHLTASVGLVVADAPSSASATLQNADLALYAAKAAGKNRVRHFDLSLRQAHLANNRLADGLRHAMAREEFTVHYQPVVELATGRVSAVEALLRWQGPDGPVSPAVFVPAAEEIGLIGQLGAWVLDRACTDACRWHTEYGLSVTVNVSGRQLRDPAFADRVLATLRRSGLPPKALVLEITETVLVTATTDETEAVSRKLARLRAHGVRIAIDDFGTGYSSLSYLRALPVDVIKIDRSFVIRVAEGSALAASPDRALLRALLELTSSLYMQPVAEGVETLDQATALRELGCRYVQGFLFARPAPATTIDTLLERTRAEMELPVP